jgi:hypothetical protein
LYSIILPPGSNEKSPGKRVISIGRTAAPKNPKWAIDVLICCALSVI